MERWMKLFAEPTHKGILTLTQKAFTGSRTERLSEKPLVKRYWTQGGIAPLNLITGKTLTSPKTDGATRFPITTFERRLTEAPKSEIIL